ncbi:hypothetical protein A2630_00865 [Candidatus Woesebacteria bacterium RIFCSPHIGHO2_01_FULL_44_10]|uniref:Amino acid transporter transmembrane domain-containing protein n=1 Tax=Candidatus Woesebacteria bacterium RIFCSPLOWO2_01_FULL_44_14 TaxID=1802525 RepID=A0A1F8C3K7_9BACT|nr:MAG: hypothetical protein A2630_00865 [Candidatus Woesebacteria bacterium RIFCSPHIGHO2_01_FULL_44_10]OGM54327.1 MAG: hypothetical protein A3F62_01060 [Candidatus Woesebacteria bacterium RIFCSPHIGHO2_12_FULL_44_11]OGM70228.1 MAG: hypothetical protein A2975_04110 [Candidatus Woesebacteria bacterium RIFCSPLOWO2_01_FULL_44_14]
MGKYLVAWVPEEPRLSHTQLQTIVDICVNIGTVGLGSVVLPTIIGRWSVPAFVFGLTGTLGFWYAAIRVSRRIL